MKDPKRILAAVELSADAEQVVERTAELAKRYGSEVVFMNVVEIIPADLSNEYILPQLQEIQDQLQQRAETRLREVAQQCALPQAKVITAQGSTKGELLRYAREQQVDLIVIGSHTRRGLARLLGSTASAVLHHAPCDVYVVRLTP